MSKKEVLLFCIVFLLVISLAGCIYESQQKAVETRKNTKPKIEFLEIKVNNKTKVEVEIDKEEKATVKTVKDIVPVFSGLRDSKGHEVSAKLKVYEKSKGGFNVEVTPEKHKIKSLKFIESDLMDANNISVKIDEISPAKIADKKFVSVYAIDPTGESFTEAKVTVTAKGNTLYKCKDWDFAAQRCNGQWVLFKKGLVPGKEYTFTLTPEDPGYGEIFITQATHLDENRSFISDIYVYVNSLNNNWSEPIYHGEYIRVTFENNLTSVHDISFYAKNNQSLNTSVEIYHYNSTELIASSQIITNTQYYKVPLSGMNGSYDKFDLRIVNDEDDAEAYLEFDHIIDPSSQVDTVTYNEFTGASYNLVHAVSGLNRLLTASISQTSTGPINSVTYAGQNLTQLRTESYKSIRVDVWYLLNPPTGANNLSISRADTSLSGVGVISYKEVDQTVAVGNDNSTSGELQEFSITIPSETGNLVQDAVTVKRYGQLAPGAEQVERWSADLGGAHGTGGSTKDGAGSVTMSWWRKDTDRYAVIAFDIKRAIPPNITNQSPVNGYINHLYRNVEFNCTLTDNNQLKNVSLYLTNNANESFSLNQTAILSGTSDSAEWPLKLPSGNYTWACEAYDNRSNVAWTENRSLIVDLPDLVPIEIRFSNNEPVENENITINAVIKNNGYNTSKVTVQFMLDNCTGTQIGTNRTISGIERNQNVSVNVSYIAVIGPNNIYVCVDPPVSTYGLIAEENEDNNELGKVLNVDGYQYFFGHVEGKVALQKQTNETKYNWVPYNGTVYATDIDGTFVFSSLQALGRTVSGAASSNDFAEADTNLGMTGFNDSITNLWASDASTPRQTTSFIVHGSILANVPYINSTNNSNFITGILWDTNGDSNGEYDGTDKELLVFVSRIKDNSTGKYGDYDYEIRVPALMRSYYAPMDQITVYLENR